MFSVVVPPTPHTDENLDKLNGHPAENKNHTDCPCPVCPLAILGYGHHQPLLEAEEKAHNNFPDGNQTQQQENLHLDNKNYTKVQNKEDRPNEEQISQREIVQRIHYPYDQPFKSQNYGQYGREFGTDEGANFGKIVSHSDKPQYVEYHSGDSNKGDPGKILSYRDKPQYVENHSGDSNKGNPVEIHSHTDKPHHVEYHSGDSNKSNPDESRSSTMQEPITPGNYAEGDLFEDYMQLFSNPFGTQSYISLSSISTSSTLSCEEPIFQRTIVIIKPEGMSFRKAILRVIFEAGFQIMNSRYVHLSPEQASEIYANLYGSPCFPQVILTICARPVLIMALGAYNVIHKWNKIIGPYGTLREEWFYPISIRKIFGIQRSKPDLIYGSKDHKSSERENRYFFPDSSILEPVICDEQKVKDYYNLMLNKCILEGCVEVCKKRPTDPIIFLADWLLTHNPYQPRFPDRIAKVKT